MDHVTLIHKVLSNSATESEKVELQTWIATDPNHAEEFEDMKLLYDNTSNIADRISERDDGFYDGLRRIQGRIKALKRARKHARFYRTAGIATLISALIIAAIYLFNLNERFGVTPETPRETDDAIILGIRLDDNLSFEDAALESIFDLLEDRYQLTIKVSSERMLSCRFTGTFYRETTMEEMIRTLAQSENFNYTVENKKTYVLNGKGCP